jgi:AraC-like DNA-binding protein
MTSAVAGIAETAVPGVRFFWTGVSTPPSPLVYEAGLVLVLQGRKDGAIEDRTFVYDADNFLTLTLPMPFVCGHVASEDEPVCGLFVSAVREDLSGLLGQMETFEPVVARTGENAMDPAPVTSDMRAAVARLIAALADPVSAAILGPALRREVLFHALRGPRGPALAAYAMQTGDDGKLDRLIETICADFSTPMTVEAMASAAGMSLSTFHRAFRARTGQTPLQYVKRLRLHAARDMILFEGARVSEAARRAGYESPSQFSREYRRHFGETAAGSHLS